MIKLIEKIEGEAKLDFRFADEKIDFVDISFTSSRDVENILRGKHALDALVINPRVCGICGHAHLIATVQALENCYDKLELSEKAKNLRELTLNFELIQNHLKWFYLTIFPLFGKKQEVLKAAYVSQLMAKAIAVFGGQYPHTSYAIVGGVVCDPTFMDVIKVKNYLDEAIVFFENNLVSAKDEKLLGCQSVESIVSKEGDLVDILQLIKENGFDELGKSYDRFIVFGENSYFQKGKSIKTRLTNNISIDYVKESVNEHLLAKNVNYKNKYYEVGPLSRAMINKIELIKDAHRRYGDSMFSRILARVCETYQLLNHSKKLLDKLNLKEESFTIPNIDISKMSGYGESAVEAARGSLIHKVELEEGLIKNYEIITPTQWNLGNGTKNKPGVSQKAMFGLSDEQTAEIVFKSFDVCSVCTTH